MLLPTLNPNKLVPNPLNDYPPRLPCPCEKNERGLGGKMFKLCCGRKPHAPITQKEADKVQRVMNSFIKKFESTPVLTGAVQINKKGPSRKQRKKDKRKTATISRRKNR